MGADDFPDALLSGLLADRVVVFADSIGETRQDAPLAAASYTHHTEP